MRRTTIWTWMVLCLAVVTASGSSSEKPAHVGADDEPQARALYERMTRSLREATALSYESSYRTGPDRHDPDHGT